MPDAKFLYVGKDWYTRASDSAWTGMRDAYVKALTEGSGCSPDLRILKDGTAAWDLETDWISVFDRRPKFSARFSTPRIGKVQNDRFYITPIALSGAAKVLIEGAGHELHYLPSRNTNRDVAYPGFSITGHTEQELAAFIAILRIVVNSHINKPA